MDRTKKEAVRPIENQMDGDLNEQRCSFRRVEPMARTIGKELKQAGHDVKAQQVKLDQKQKCSAAHSME